MKHSIALCALFNAASGQDADGTTMLQMQMRTPNLPKLDDHPRMSATALLSKVQSMATTLKKNQQDPLRQCQGGWQAGGGNGFQESAGTVDDQAACIAAVRENSDCEGATGASFEAETGNCFCEMDQEELDSSVEGRENCVFFADGTTDENLDMATSALDDLVANILQAMDQEHVAAERIIENSFDGVSAALTLSNTHSAENVRQLQADAETKHAASQQCISDLTTWQAEQAEACPAWEDKARSYGACNDACPCQSDGNPEVFFNSYLVWKSIIQHGGGEEIEAMRAACQEATSRVNELLGSCPALEAESTQADAIYAMASVEHTESCTNFEGAVVHHETTASELRLGLEQRNREYCVLQQVQCFLGLIRTATETGTLLDDETIQECVCTPPEDPVYHLAPGGANVCDFGEPATRDACEAAVAILAEEEGASPGRALQVGQGGGCNDGGWGSVPGGCSSQSGGDWAAHWKTDFTAEGCVHGAYQLVCTGEEGPCVCADNYFLSFPEVPASPDCVEGAALEVGETVAFDQSGSVCSAHAPYWTGGENCDTSAHQLHFDQWFQQGGQNAYWQIVTESPEIFVKFSMQVSRGPAYAIRYSDDGTTWSTAATVASATTNSEVEWSPVGAHRYWRYEITGDWSGGPWYLNLQFYTATYEVERDDALRLQVGPPVAFDYAGSVCSALAPYWTGGVNCDTSAHQLHYDQWFQQDGQNAYWQVITENPEMFVRFSMQVSRGPAFAIRYSDDGSNWETAATVDSTTQNSDVTWSPVGAHRFWRYEITGDWSGGPWYLNLQFYSAAFSVERPPPQHCSANGANDVVRLDQDAANALSANPNFAAQAAGAVPFGSGSLGGHCSNTGAGAGNTFGGSGIHCWDNINDGQHGNSYSWIPGNNAFATGGAPKIFAGITFNQVETISSFTLSRDRTGAYGDRTGGSYELQYTTTPGATFDTPDDAWCTAGTFTRNTHTLMGFSLSSAVEASAVRLIVSDGQACIDELEVY